MGLPACPRVEGTGGVASSTWGTPSPPDERQDGRRLCPEHGDAERDMDGEVAVVAKLIWLPMAKKITVEAMTSQRA